MVNEERCFMGEPSRSCPIVVIFFDCCPTEDLEETTSTDSQGAMLGTHKFWHSRASCRLASRFFESLTRAAR